VCVCVCVCVCRYKRADCHRQVDSVRKRTWRECDEVRNVQPPHLTVIMVPPSSAGCCAKHRYRLVSVCTLLGSVQQLSSAWFPFTRKGWTQILCEFRGKDTTHVPPIIFVVCLSVCSGVRTAWPIVLKLAMACVHQTFWSNHNYRLISGILKTIY
jgi:hypothetical protein